jgi:hypothetical protein
MPITPTGELSALSFAGMPPIIHLRDPSELLAVRSAVDTISRSGAIPSGRQLSFPIDMATQEVVV